MFTEVGADIGQQWSGPARFAQCHFGNPFSGLSALEQWGWCPILPDTLAPSHRCPPQKKATATTMTPGCHVWSWRLRTAQLQGVTGIS